MSEQTRREILKRGGQVALGGALATAGAAAAPRLAKAAAERQWGMLVDLRRCIGCQACTVACKAENGVPLGVFRRRVRTLMTGSFPEVGRHFVPISCFHCEKPKCLPACDKHKCYDGQSETALYKREDGTVLIDEAKCKPGKKPCMTACPYNNIFYDPLTKKADKCTFCEHRVDQGVAPACVQTCEGGALQFGDVKDPSSAIARAIAANDTKVLKPRKKMNPSFHYIGLDDDVQKTVEGMIKGKQLRPTDLENDR